MSIEALSAVDLNSVCGGAGTCPAVAPGTTRDQFTRGAVGDYLRAGGPRATAQKIVDRVRYQLDSDPGNFDRYTSVIRSRPGGEAYLAAMSCRDSVGS